MFPVHCPRSQEPGAPQSPLAAGRQVELSPRSMQSSSTEAAAAAAKIVAPAIAAATGMPDAARRIPTVLSFNHLQSQAESVLCLTAEAAAATAAAAMQGGAGEP